MKLTIIPSDKAVYKDNLCYDNLNLISANIPSNIHALQWDNNAGHIEFINNEKLNEEITDLPQWALDCEIIWQKAYDAEQKVIADAKAQQEIL